MRAAVAKGRARAGESSTAVASATAIGRRSETTTSTSASTSTAAAASSSSTTTTATNGITGSSITIPVSRRVAKTLTDGNGTVTPLLRGLDDMLSQGRHRVGVDIVFETDVRVATGVGADGAIKNVHAVLDSTGALVVKVERVNVPHDDVVAEGGHVGQAGAVAVAIGGPHVSGEIAEGAAEEFLVQRHLLAAAGGIESVEVGMVKGVGSHLVALGGHAADDIGVGGLAGVSPVETVDEKGGLDAIPGEEIQKLAGVHKRSVVKSDGNGARRAAGGDADSIWH